MEKNLVKCEKMGLEDSANTPVGRSGHRIACLGGNIYVIGGYAQYPNDLQVVGEVWVYNIMSERWHQLELPSDWPYTQALSSAVVAVGSNRLIINGGTSIPFGEQIDNSLLEVNVDTGTFRNYLWKPKDGLETNIPRATYGHSLTFVHWGGKDFLFKVGGARGIHYTNQISAFTFSEVTWETVFPEDQESTFNARYRHDVAFWKGKLYMIGGSNGFDNLEFWPMPAYDIDTRSFTFIEFVGEKPKPLRCQCSVQLNEMIFTTGGAEENPESLNGDILAFNLETLVFSIVGRHPSPTFFHDLTLIPGQNQFFSFGGVRDKNRVNDIHCFTICNGSPIALSELAWRSFSSNLSVFFATSTASNHKESAGDVNDMSRYQRLFGLPVGHIDISSGVKSVFYGLIGTIGAVNKIFSSSSGSKRAMESHDSSSEFYNWINTTYLEMRMRISEDRVINSFESASLFVTLLAHEIGVPFRFILRLPFGYRCLKTVTEHLRTRDLPRIQEPVSTSTLKKLCDSAIEASL